MLSCQHHVEYLMTCGERSNDYSRPHPHMRKGGATAPMTASCSMACSTCSGRAVHGAHCRSQTSVRGRPSMIALPNGSVVESLSRFGRAVYISMMTPTGSSGSGSQPTGPMCGHRRGGKEAGPNPTDRAKPGYKDHLLVDGCGVPLSSVIIAANVNDGPTLPAVLNNSPIVRPRPDREHPQHLCLDAAFDNAPARQVVLIENYVGHIAPKGGRAEDAPSHEGGWARRWVVERTHAWHDRFRRLVVNWEKTITSRYAFLCLANVLIAYRM